MKILIIFMIALICSVQCLGQKTYEAGLEYCEIKIKLTKKEDLNRENMGPICMVGFQLPKMKAYTTLSGKIVSDVYFKNKLTVINFWFEGCPPCEAEIPGFNILFDKYHDKVNFLAIGRNSKADITDYLKTHPWKFDHIAGSALISDVFNLRWGFPTTLVVDQNLTIQAAFSGGRTDDLATKEIVDKLSDIIDKLIQK